MDFHKIFRKRKPIIGMIHLAGKSQREIINRALKELKLYEEEGVDGVIIEDYHGTEEDVVRVLKASNNPEFKIIKGVNVLADPYSSFKLVQEYGARFVQFDSIQSNDLELNIYDTLKKRYPEIAVLGGIRFKYTISTGKSLEGDLAFGKKYSDAIVTTGDGTGIETPLQKLRDFKKILKKFPLIVGAGVNETNVHDSLIIADGAIIGSYFKGGDTKGEVIRENVRGLMEIVNQVRGL